MMRGDLVARMAAMCDAHALLPHGVHVVVGVSGGVDSLVLLHVLITLRESRHLMLHAAVLDHGVRGAGSAADAAFVRTTAAAWDVPVTVGYADVPRIAREHGLGIEEAARHVRYAFLGRVAQAVGADRVAVGHQRDDQAETVLLHLIRGSGIEGLRGMLPLVNLPGAAIDPATVQMTFDPPPGLSHVSDATSPAAAAPTSPAPRLIRPLLDQPRAAIDAYATAHNLHPREDVTNRDPAYTRNRLRHTIIPQLETLNPKVRAALARTADLLRTDAERLHLAGEAALEDVLREQMPGALVLDRVRWATLHLADQRYTIRAAVGRLRPDLRDLSFAHVEAAIQVADADGAGAQAVLPDGMLVGVGERVIVVAQDVAVLADALIAHIDAPALGTDDAIAFRAGEALTQRVGAWVVDVWPIDTADGAIDDKIAALHADPLAAALAVPVGAVLRLRPREPGDRFQPRGMGGHSQPLTTTLSGMDVPQAWRARVPVLCTDGFALWFVAPSADGVRGRVSAQAAVPGDLPRELVPATRLIGVRWRRHEAYVR